MIRTFGKESGKPNRRYHFSIDAFDGKICLDKKIERPGNPNIIVDPSVQCLTAGDSTQYMSAANLRNS